MTTIKHGLVGEDALVFGQPLAYSIKSNDRVVLLRVRADQVKKWPSEIQNNLKMHSLDKYRVFFTQVQAVQVKLTTPDNRYILDMETKM